MFYLNVEKSKGKPRFQFALTCTEVTGKQNEMYMNHRKSANHLRKEADSSALSSHRVSVFLSKCTLSFHFKSLDKPFPHTMESRISEPSLTRGRGLEGEIST